MQIILFKLYQCTSSPWHLSRICCPDKQKCSLLVNLEDQKLVSTFLHIYGCLVFLDMLRNFDITPTIQKLLHYTRWAWADCEGITVTISLFGCLQFIICYKNQRECFHINKEINLGKRSFSCESVKNVLSWYLTSLFSSQNTNFSHLQIVFPI